MLIARIVPRGYRYAALRAERHGQGTRCTGDPCALLTRRISRRKHQRAAAQPPPVRVVRTCARFVHRAIRDRRAIFRSGQRRDGWARPRRSDRTSCPRTYRGHETNGYGLPGRTSTCPACRSWNDGTRTRSSISQEHAVMPGESRESMKGRFDVGSRPRGTVASGART